jgi:hypothetical protein
MEQTEASGMTRSLPPPVPPVPMAQDQRRFGMAVFTCVDNARVVPRRSRSGIGDRSPGARVVTLRGLRSSRNTSGPRVVSTRSATPDIARGEVPRQGLCALRRCQALPGQSETTTGPSSVFHLCSSVPICGLILRFVWRPGWFTGGLSNLPVFLDALARRESQLSGTGRVAN